MILEIDKNFPQPGIIEHAVEIITKNNGVFVYPTDTIYGIGAKINDFIAINKINKIKSRDKSKNYSIMFKDIKQLQKYITTNPWQLKIIKKHLPGSFTFILKANNNLPNYLKAKDGTIGVRVTKNKTCISLIKALNSPIISTSFNISNKPNITNIKKVNKVFLNKFDVVLNSGILNNIPSTIVDLTKKPPVILRQGIGNFKI